MGIYDKIYLKFRCPYCKEVSEMEFQTKDGNYDFSNYKVGDKFQEGQFRRIDAIGSCDSFTCQLEAAKESVWESGYYGGFSRSFDVYIDCDSKGRITNKVKVYSLNMHKGVFNGNVGEIPDRDYKYKPQKRKGKGFNKTWMARKVKIKTNGWLDKFDDDKERYFFENGKPIYEAVMYLFNLTDSAEAFEHWFVLRYELRSILDYLIKDLKIKKDEELRSVFMSNYKQIPKLIECVNSKESVK